MVTKHENNQFFSAILTLINIIGIGFLNYYVALNRKAMRRIGQFILWGVIALVFSPVAFVMMPLIIIGSVIWALVMELKGWLIIVHQKPGLTNTASV